MRVKKAKKEQLRDERGEMRVKKAKKEQLRDERGEILMLNSKFQITSGCPISRFHCTDAYCC